MNRTKIVIAVIAVAVLLAVGNAQTDKPQQPVGPVGRYQIHLVDHTVTVATASSGGSVVRDVLRVDTTTGEADVWRNGVSRDGQQFSAWSPIR